MLSYSTRTLHVLQKTSERSSIFAGESIFIAAAMSQCPVLSGAFDPFSLDRWDPGNCPFLKDIAHFPTQDVTPIANTPVDWKETSDAHIFKADLPGLKKEEVKIEVEDDRVLQISGERKEEEAQKNDKWHRIERSQGKFLRRFRLPENAKIAEVKATMDNGVLTVTVPKQPEAKPVVRAIEIDG